MQKPAQKPNALSRDSNEFKRVHYLMTNMVMPITDRKPARDV